MKNRFAFLLGAVLTALAASACCVLPALLSAVGAGAAAGFGAVFAPYRPLFVTLTLLLLAIGFYFTYRKPHEEGDSCCLPQERQTADSKGTPHRRVQFTQRGARALLWVVTAFVLATLLYPWIADRILQMQKPSTLAPSSIAKTNIRARTVVFATHLDCAACALTIKRALSSTKGVLNVQVDMQKQEIKVLYNPQQTSPRSIAEKISSLGYSVQIVPPKPTPCCPASTPHNKT